MKRSAIRVFAAAAFAVLAIPTGSSAIWQDNHQNLQQNVNTQGTGLYKIGNTANRWVACQMTANVQLLAGQTTAKVIGTHLDNVPPQTATEACQIGTGFQAIGCTGLKSMTAEGLPWTVHALTTQTLALTSGTIRTEIHGGIFCPDQILFTPGTVHITMNAGNTFSQGCLSGALAFDTQFNQEQVWIEGCVEANPSSTYGVA